MGLYFSKNTIKKNGLRAIVQQLELADGCSGICYERAKELTELLPHLYIYAPNDQAVKDLQHLHDKLIRASLMDGMDDFTIHHIAKLYEAPYRAAGAMLLDWVLETGGGSLKGEAEEEMQELVEQEKPELV